MSLLLVVKAGWGRTRAHTVGPTGIIVAVAWRSRRHSNNSVLRDWLLEPRSSIDTCHIICLVGKASPRMADSSFKHPSHPLVQ